MACSCGQTMTVDAATREEAVNKMKMMMDQKGVDDHWMQFHQKDANPKPPMEEVHTMIDKTLQEVMVAPGM